MKSLADAVFGRINVDPELIAEYHERSKRKSEDDKWLKSNKPAVLDAMIEAGKDKADYGNFRVSVTTPDESKFDTEKLADYLLCKGYDFCVIQKPTINEEALAELIERDEIDLGELKAAAWIEKTGTPRLSVKHL